MPDQDKRAAVVASGKAGGKQPSPALPKLNLCGDIGLKIGRDGTWYYQGGPIGRKALVKLFASVLRREDDGALPGDAGGEGADRGRGRCHSSPWTCGIEGSGKTQSLFFRSNVDDVVAAGPDHPLGFEAGPDGSFTPFVVVRDGLKARLARPVYYELARLGGRGWRRRTGRVERRAVFPVSPTDRSGG